MRTGDVLTRAGRRELRAVADLYAALDDAAADSRLRLELMRGAEQHRATLSLPPDLGADATLPPAGGRAAGGGEHRL
jgi:S1-C subfamily serine protease